MKIGIAFILIFAVTFCAPFFVDCQEVASQEAIGADQCAETATETPQPSILDRASDWWATLGKSDEEKVQILEERNLRRLEQGSQSTVEELRIKTQEKISTIQEEAKNKAITVKEEIKNKTVNLKEEAAQRVAEAKEKTCQKIAEAKQQARQKIGETKTEISSNVETKKQQIKQESEKTIKGFLDGLLK